MGRLGPPQLAIEHGPPIVKIWGDIQQHLSSTTKGPWGIKPKTGISTFHTGIQWKRYATTTGIETIGNLGTEPMI